MTYKLEFLPSATKEWRKLGATIQRQLKKKLLERLEQPRVPAARLHGVQNRYKIKLRQSGYRLVYEVRDREIVVVVIAIGKRERGEVYGRRGSGSIIFNQSITISNHLPTVPRPK